MKYCNKLFISVVFICFIPFQSNAFDLVEETDNIDVWSLTAEENIKYPVVPNNVVASIKQNINYQYNNLKELGYNVRLVRNNEVIMITIPIDNLFKTNVYDEILQQGKRKLEPILPFFRIKEMYRVVFLLHHDNSLSPKDADFITNERVLTLSEWFIDKNNNAKNIIPYSMGVDYPIVTEASKIGREKNRRLEIFILPGQTMIDLAKDNKLCNFVEK